MQTASIIRTDLHFVLGISVKELVNSNLLMVQQLNQRKYLTDFKNNVYCRLGIFHNIWGSK